MSIQSSEFVLLTGAGFTHNFGAPLANEMWVQIFNHTKVQANPLVREKMLKDFNFESCYSKIMWDESANKEDKEAIEVAVTSAYEKIDAIARDDSLKRKQSEAIPTSLQKLITRFARTSRQGFFFTLNQDLFIERNYYNSERPIIPGVVQKPKWLTKEFQEPLNEEDLCQLPTEEELEATKEEILTTGKFFYIKLHGSFNWRSSDGHGRIVIGLNKMEQIQKEPLLKWYSDIFKQVIRQNNCRLLVIGYGFGDAHINEIIAKAIVDYELKVHIISPELPHDFKTKLLTPSRAGLRDGQRIWNGLAGYFPYSLLQMFPGNKSETHASRNLYENFFGIKP